MEDKVIGKFGNLTLVNVDSFDFPLNVIICEKDKYNECIILPAGLLDSLLNMCIYNEDYFSFESEQYSFSCENKCIKFSSPFANFSTEYENLAELCTFLDNNLKR